MSDSTYVNTARRPVDLETGQIVSSGERVELTLDNEHDKALVESGVLVKVRASDLAAEEKAANKNKGGDTA